ncbi:MAG TPA: hypothetical protein VHK90_05540 [Thermoanaerobaculia bacterium]|nr:hypothetical protein [Thermoanaerobaculia bacterium]
MKHVRAVIALAVTAAAVRLLPLQFLHPLNWDELEFWRATSWIAEGRMPYRDFWEHHTPLVWFLFAPFTRLTTSPGVDAILVLRWAQIPLWIATFWLANVWMRNAGIERFARWSAMTLALASSLFMIPAVEYRVEALGCALVLGGLVLAQRERYALAGVAFCLAGFANLRLGPVLVVAVLALLAARRLRSWPIVIGGSATLIAVLALCYANGMLEPLWQQVWTDNLAEKYATPVIGGFIHRLLVPFGVRIIATDRLFELAAVDVGGAAVLLFGFAGLLLAFRRRGLWLIALLQLTNLFFIASMKFIYNYHFALVVILMIPLIAGVFERVSGRVVLAVLIAAVGVSIFASVFRGKELDRAYQDFIMREVHARTRPGDVVWSGVPWALHREPAYRFWFLPELARQLVRQDLAPRYRPEVAPAAVVFDHNVLLWIGTVQRELAPFFVRHYVPVWRELWVPGMNARLRPGGTFTWIVPRDGAYRVYVSAPLAGHPWFHDPLRAASYKRADAARLTFELPEPGPGAVTFDADPSRLRAGQRLTAMNPSGSELAVFVLPANDRVLFRQPPPGATLEAETTRVTHVPRLWR